MRTVLPKTRFHPASVFRKAPADSGREALSPGAELARYSSPSVLDTVALSNVTSRSAAFEQASHLLRLPSAYTAVRTAVRPPRPQFQRPSGVALLDAPNLRCALHDEIGRAPHGQDDLNLRQLREWHKTSLMIRKCYFVTRRHPDRPRDALRDAVRRCTWKWVDPDHSRYDHNEDPVDDYIIQRIVELTEHFPHHHQRTISIVSHDGGYADYLEQFLDVGGYVAIVGILSRMSGKLYRLSDHPRVELFDLELDVRAVNLPGGPTQWREPYDSLAN